MYRKKGMDLLNEVPVTHNQEIELLSWDVKIIEVI